jgi:hypothetical protein
LERWVMSSERKKVDVALKGMALGASFDRAGLNQSVVSLEKQCDRLILNVEALHKYSNAVTAISKCWVRRLSRHGLTVQIAWGNGAEAALSSLESS